jgi:hypothetical protein
LIKSTQEWTDLIAGTPFGTGDRWWKLDIKELFLSGEFDELVKDATSLVTDRRLRSLLAEVLHFLLDKQYVKAVHLPGRLFKVRRGSVMGYQHSGDLCDYAFRAKCE